MKPAISISALATKVAKETGAAEVRLRNFLESVTSLVPLAIGDKDFLEFAIGYLLRAAYGAKAASGLYPELANQFTRLLSFESSLGLTGKAQNILWGHGNVFTDANLISQIRPVFLTDLSSKAENAAIIHELRIDFNSNSRDGSICFIIDSAKIQRLLTVLNRAIYKEQNLRNSPAFNYLTE